MKEKDITPEVIKLSKEIAELYRMEIYKGCWVGWSSDDGLDLVTTELGVAFLNKSEKRLWFPIPLISDCLEKLRELGWRNYQFSFAENENLEMHILHIPYK